MMARVKLWSNVAALLAAAALTPPSAGAQAARDSVRQLSLADALRIAEEASEDIHIAAAGVRRAEGQVVQARSEFLPQLTGSLSYTRTLRSQFQGFSAESDTTSEAPECRTFVPDTTAPLGERVRLLERALGCTSGDDGFGNFSDVGFGAANQYNLGLSLSQNLFTGGRITAQFHQAQAARQSADIALTSARAQVLLDVAQAYYDATLADRLLDIAQATLAQADTTLAQTRLARQVGTQPEFELLRAQVARNNQVPVVIQRRADRDQAYLRLQQLLNLPSTQPLVLTTELGDTTTVLPARLTTATGHAPDTSVSARAPVRQAAENVVAQREALTAARSRRVPTITLSSAFGRVAFPAGGFPNWGDFRTNWTITGSLEVPLYLGGAIHGQAMVAEANLREAEAQLRQTRQLAALDVSDAFAQLRAAEAQFAASTGTTDQATRAYQIAELRYREGISTQTELGDTRIQLQQAQANRAQAARDLQVARMRVALLRDLPLAGAPVTATTPTTTAPSNMPFQAPQTRPQVPGQPTQTPLPATSAARSSRRGRVP